MNLTAFRNELHVIISGFKIHLNTKLIKETFNSFIFCSFFFVLILGISNSTWKGLASYMFEYIHYEYHNMDIYSMINKDYAAFVGCRHDIFLAIISTLFIYLYEIATKKNFSCMFKPNVFQAIFFYQIRIFSLVYIGGFVFIPLLSITILNHVNDTEKNFLMFPGLQYEIKLFLLCVLALFSYAVIQLKNLESTLNLRTREQVKIVKEKFSFVLLILIWISLVVFAKNFVKPTDGYELINDSAFATNQCIHTINTGKVDTACKAALIEDNCKTIPECYKLKDDRLIEACIVRKYQNSNAFFDFQKTRSPIS